MTNGNHRNTPEGITSDPATPEELRHAEVCAYVFGELEGTERVAFEERLASDATLRAERDELAATVGLVQDALPPEALPADLRATLTAAAEGTARAAQRRSGFRLLSGGLSSGAFRAAAGLVLIFGVAFAVRRLADTTPTHAPADDAARRVARLDLEREAPGGPKEVERFLGGERDALRSEAGKDRFQRAGGAYEEAAEEGGSELAQRELQDLTDELREVGDVASSSSFEAPAESPAGEPAPTLPSSEQLIANEPAAGADGFFLGRGEKKKQDVTAGLLESESEEQVPGNRFRGPGDTVPPGGGGPSSPGPVVVDSPGPPSSKRGRRAKSSAPASPSPKGGRAGAPVRSQEVAPARQNAPGLAAQAASEEHLDEVLQALGERDLDAQVLLRVDELAAMGYAQDPGERVEEQLTRLRGLGYLDGDDGEGEIPIPLNRVGEKNETTFRWSDTATPDDKAQDADQLADLEETSDTRRPVLSPEGVRVLGDRLLATTRVLPVESPGAMFFRYWGAHPFVSTADDPLSTFAADVDTASYTLTRRYLADGNLPPRASVRTEEFVNYFDADLDAPAEGTFAIGMELAPSPFTDDPLTELLRVTVRGKDVADFERQPVALTFVVDSSQSMEEGGRMGLVKDSLGLLFTQLAPTDSVGLVRFANEGHVLSPMVSASARGALEDIVTALVPEGGTNVEAGLWKGYEVASNGLTPHAVNRVVLLSDGVGNIGETDQARILAKVEEFKSEGIYLNTVGVGMGNHDDTFLEQLADQGDGLAQYVDSAREAEKALVHDFTKTLQPIARDVKIQVEFDPAVVTSYRQLGYENRVVADADFRNDAVDAGELNAGHQVTALYEIRRSVGAASDARIATARVRYKPPFAVDAGALGKTAREEVEVASELTAWIAAGDAVSGFESASYGFRRAVVVAQFAEVLRQSVHTRRDSLGTLVAEARKLAQVAEQRADAETAELFDLVQRAQPRLDERAAQDADEELGELLDQLALLHFEVGVRAQTRASEAEADSAREADAAARIAELEDEVQRILAERYGVAPELDPASVEALKALGYTGEER